MHNTENYRHFHSGRPLGTLLQGSGVMTNGLGSYLQSAYPLLSTAGQLLGLQGTGPISQQAGPILQGAGPVLLGLGSLLHGGGHHSHLRPLKHNSNFLINTLIPLIQHVAASQQEENKPSQTNNNKSSRIVNSPKASGMSQSTGDKIKSGNIRSSSKM